MDSDPMDDGRQLIADIRAAGDLAALEQLRVAALGKQGCRYHPVPPGDFAYLPA